MPSLGLPAPRPSAAWAVLHQDGEPRASCERDMERCLNFCTINGKELLVKQQHSGGSIVPTYEENSDDCMYNVAKSQQQTRVLDAALIHQNNEATCCVIIRAAKLIRIGTSDVCAHRAEGNRSGSSGPMPGRRPAQNTATAVHWISEFLIYNRRERHRVGRRWREFASAHQEVLR